MTTLVGALVVAAAGLLMGGGAWPFKLMKVYKFEHWWFINMLVGLVIMPWAITLLGCPEPFKALSNVPMKAIILGNVFAVGWGIANVLCGICYVRIGVALTGAILAGLGASAGAIVPLIFKGSGLFEDASDVFSPAGIAVLLCVGVLLVGVVLASLAGFGRDRALAKPVDGDGASAPVAARDSGDFLGGLIMTVIAGVLSSFMAFAFVYSQGPIVAQFSRIEPNTDVTLTVKNDRALSGKFTVSGDGSIALGSSRSAKVGGLTAQEAADKVAAVLGRADSKGIQLTTGSIPATFAVFAIALMGGALVNLGYTGYLMTRNRSWGVLAQSPFELLLGTIMGIEFCIAASMNGVGMLLLGALGASVGWGIQQAMQMTGTQLLGFISGEWRGVIGKPRVQMYLAIGVFIVASVLMACVNAFLK